MNAHLEHSPDATGARDADMSFAQYWHPTRIGIAWATAVVFSIAVVIWAPAASRFEWLAVAVGVCAIVSFGLQLGTAQKRGFISRLSFSVVGSVIIIMVFELVLLLLF